MSDLVLRPLAVEPTELSRVLGLLRQIWPDPDKMTSRYLEWLYAENPDGEAVGVNAWDGDVLAGHYVVVPARVKLLGRSTRALLSLHTAVHPDYRGKRLFQGMAEQSYQMGRELGFDHVFGVANANSTTGFVRDLGFQLVSPLHLRFVTGWPAPPDGSHAEWIREWTDAAFAWRLRHPQFQYSRRSVRGSTLYLLHRRRVETVVRIAPRGHAAPPCATSSGLLPLPRVWVGLNASIRFRGPSFAFPKRLRSSPLNFIFRSLTTPELRLDPEKVVFEGIDFDVF